MSKQKITKIVNFKIIKEKIQLTFMISWKLEFFQQDPNIHRQKTKIKHLFLT